jgi:hypothetical protein
VFSHRAGRFALLSPAFTLTVAQLPPLRAQPQNAQTQSKPTQSPQEMQPPETRLLDLNAQAGAPAQRGKHADAIPIATEAFMETETAFGPDDPHVGSSLNRLAPLYFHQARQADAEPFL